MKTLTNLSQLPRWFILDKYNSVQQFSLAQWKEELEFRREIVSITKIFRFEDDYLDRESDFNSQLKNITWKSYHFAPYNRYLTMMMNLSKSLVFGHRNGAC